MADIFLSPLKRCYEFNQIIENVKEGKSPVHVNGLVQSQKAHFGAGLFKYSGIKQGLIITHSDLEAKKIYEDMRFYAGEAAAFMPCSDIFFYSLEARDRNEEAKRIDVLRRLAKGERIILISSIDNLMRKYVPKNIFFESLIEVNSNDTVDIEALSRKLAALGYERESKVEGVGQFSIRGGIIDIFSPGFENPVRIELFGDEIDSMRTFDSLSQKSIERVDSVTIAPAREVIYAPGFDPKLSANIHETAGLSEELSGKMEKLSQRIYFEGIENHIDYIYERPSTLLDYLGAESLVIMNEPERVLQRAKNFASEFSEIFVASLERGEAGSEQGNLLFAMDDIQERFEGKTLLMLATLPKDVEGFNRASAYSFSAREVPSFGGKLEMAAGEIKFLKEKGHSILISIGSPDKAKGLQEMLSSHSIECSVTSDRSYAIRPSQVVISPGDVSAGFSYLDCAFTLVTDTEILGAHKKTFQKKKTRSKNARQIESFMELEIGDYVVHESHGIGKYEGMKQLVVGDVTKDYLRIVYSAGDTLYVPTDQLDKVQKYIGGEGERVKLSKLGTSEWSKAKAKAQKAVEEMAKELIELYAKREGMKGYQFGEDTPWQFEFENLFPHEETQDQKRAIEEVKKDMESDGIMDRLICGDVGYGKTEVAIRAVFKACMESKQVVVLVPTTILAQQHYNTFRERFEKFPIRVEVLSRFKTEKEQSRIADDIRRGLVDVVIGTHRLLSDDIKFKDLGLLVIDEEQRFGVKHKEKIKSLKASVDVLAMSATPIPRTLHMSLTGIRDMSIIEEPPEERHPVLTFVVEAKESIIADAIEREISRGGQVFFVYNRVGGIEDMAARIKKLVPSARIDLGHGQMSARQLENVMMRFLQRETDVLVCTTIIETGMDIANANTMIVFDADKMGLSQLYQLRGRVGRSSRQGYAYFIYEKDKMLTEISEKRLKAIKEFTEFGSGFKIAMRDLEIRGAGNLLGSQQHGHMSAIGYDLYVKMLSGAIRRLKGEEERPEVDTEIELKLNAYIPQDYIQDELAKIEIYKKIASIESKDEMYEIEEEIEDRFSDIPLPVRTLIMTAYVKSMAQKLGVKAIKHHKEKIYIEPYYMFKPKEEKEDYKLITEIAMVMEKMLQ
ncbi:transcription-repair-coupling factor Mfd [Peptoclostridium acidaminophilum DSM 3953]|uniref:Transcription-repair-coupling factor n=1 Tax=Peptoclostridium acidaminophilum DSM 3953 TaxID=1286171 RepID=W8TH74_PEPAC|nr:transcription-repair coupling factor [Peptoclostridium acidaminophilum]AHM55547.1 transcription-repair-coupling factor Mfd [Peptoclostridium acidaminophilum DSM 3953]